MDKTNVMKILDQKKIKYDFFIYNPEITDGVLVANLVKKECYEVFKTLVTIDSGGIYHVFCIPVDKTLDVKKAAKLLNKKSIDMIKQKELEPLTGYVHGGCSPIGMKKKFPTYFDSSINDLCYVCISGGKRGYQVQIDKDELIKLTQGRVIDLVL